MPTGAIDVGRFLHRFALRAAILARLHLARTRRMRTFLAVCHFVLLWTRDEILKVLLATRDLFLKVGLRWLGTLPGVYISQQQIVSNNQEKPLAKTTTSGRFGKNSSCRFRSEVFRSNP